VKLELKYMIGQWQGVCGQSKVGRRDLFKNDGNVWSLSGK
jgi:hypothetical protein